MKKILFKHLFLVFIALLSGLLSACQMNNIEGEVKKSYTVTDESFSVEDIGPTLSHIVNVQNGSHTYEYYIDCKAYCSVSLYEYSADIKIYSITNSLLETKTMFEEKEIKSNKEFSFSIPISEYLYTKANLVEVQFTGKSYESPKPIEKSYQVTFMKLNGGNNERVVVKSGQTVSTPKDPTKTNYIFSGWYTDAAYLNKYDFSKPVRKSFVLYAKYEIDASNITNQISSNIIKGIVKVYNKNYNTFLGFETEEETVTGNGFCFQKNNGYYYIIVNNSTIKKRSSYENQKITIEDYEGRTYDGYVYQNQNLDYLAMTASYDLACVWFKPTSSNVKPLEISYINPGINDEIVSVSSTSNQKNIITYCNVDEYKKVQTNMSQSLSNVKFKVLEHSGYVSGALKGGIILNSNLQVVGIDYATASNKKYSIPIEKVVEFIKKYVTGQIV